MKKLEKGTPEHDAHLAHRREYIRNRRASMTPEQREKERAKCRGWHEKNRDKALARMSRRRAKNPGESAAASAAWRDLNPGKQAELNRAWKSSNEDAIRAYAEANRLRKRESNKAWQMANPLAVVATAHRRRARIAGGGGSFTKSDVLELLAAQAWKCAYCEVSVAEGGFEVDHFIPVAKGGPNVKGNLRIACQTCNRQKGQKDPSEFMRWRAYRAVDRRESTTVP